MHRDKLTEKLVRIVQSIESGELPMDIRELYVFGSHSRGAIDPNDLDIIIVQGPGIQEVERQVDIELKRKYPDILEQIRRGQGRHEAARQRLFRKPGEPIQILFTQQLSSVTGEGSRIKPEDPILIWSTNDRQWRKKIAAITPDAHAGRAERNHLIELKRIHDGVATMEYVVRLIESDSLKFSRIPKESIEVKLNPWHTRSLEHWIECKVMGKQSMELLPYVMWWFEQKKDRSDVPIRTEIWSNSQRFRCEVGKPSLNWMLNRFDEFPKLKQQCLIPHFKQKGPNDLLVFERGPKWSSREPDED